MSAGPRVLAAAIVVLGSSATAQLSFEDLYADAEEVRTRGEAPAEDVHRAYARALRAFLRIPPDRPSYGPNLPAGAFCAYQSGSHELAARLFGEALDHGGPTDFLVDYRLRALVQAGRVGAALDEARSRQAASPDGVRAFVVAARGLERGALFAEAARRLRAGGGDAAVWPFRVAADAAGGAIDLGNLALSLRFLGRLDEATALYRRSLELAPDDDVLWNDYGLCLKSAGRPDEAVGAFRRSLELEAAPGAGPATTNLVLLWRNGRADAIDEPLERLRVLLARRPDADLARRLYLDGILGRYVAPGAGSHDKRRDRR